MNNENPERDEWRAIVGYDGLYEVNRNGVIVSLPKRSGKGKIYKRAVMSPYINYSGYPCIGLYANGIRKGFFVHRIVAQTFIENPENKPCVDHIDTDTMNPSSSNLRWCTRSENSMNPITRVRQSVRQIGSKNHAFGLFGSDSKRSVPVIQYSIDGFEIRRWGSMIDACSFYGLGRGTIQTAIRQRTGMSAGFMWKIDFENLIKKRNDAKERIKNPRISRRKPQECKNC